ncbi:MAG: HAD-IC family P-type ATPase, partial [Hyphomicrobiales bacterium]
RRGPMRRLLAQFNNVLLYVLLGSAAVTAALGHGVDTIVILAVVLINAIIGFVQEGRAEHALEAIRTMLSPHADVRRGGRRMTVMAEMLVPGDVVLVQSGDRVPADLRLLDAKSLQIDEAALTGESVAVEKTSAPVRGDAELGDRGSMAYAGTLVTYGKGTGIVVETGARSEIGRISATLAGIEPLTTPLLRQISVFAQWLTGAILLVSAGTFAFGFLVQGYSASEMFMAAVAFAVAAIPEGMPPVMTISLAIGVTRMAQRNAIVRRLPAVEALGSVTVICTDKTGTLTRNELMVETVVTAAQSYTVTGAGYEPVGVFCLSEEPVATGDHPDLMSVARAALLCNDAELTEKDGLWELQGDPTDGALMTVGLKAGLDTRFERQSWPRMDLIPFESEHRFMASLHHDHAGHGRIYVKGAPERILDMCAGQRSDDGDVPLDRAYWLGRIEAMASQAQRVLAIADRKVSSDHRELRFEDAEDGLTLLGLFGLIDLPRTDAVEAVALCRQAGIRVKMITGDHAATAAAIAAKFGLGGTHATVTGKELDRISGDALVTVAREADVFARAMPDHKLRLVQALQADGEVVAMTGDGVNDSPALKRADIGVAMGRKGTEAAKEAAEIVLADDNFASIAHAVEEGRTVYENLKKSILFLLPTSGGEALIIVTAILLGQTLPVTPVQILWVNMITAVTLGIALAFEPTETDVMKRPPRAPDAPILSAFLTWRVAFVSLLLLAGAFGLFTWQRATGASLETARTVAVNTLVVGEIVYILNCRRIAGPSWTWDGMFGSRPILISIAIVIVFQVLITYMPFMQLLFQTAPLGAAAWAQIALFGAGLFALVELEKATLQRLEHDRHVSADRPG